MKQLLKHYSDINKFSQNVMKILLMVAALISSAGAILLKFSLTYYQIFISRKLIETGFCFIMLAFALSFLTDYLYKTKG